MRGRADDMMAQGQYARAAETYDRILAEHPGDAEALRLRDHARNRVLEQVLVEAASARAANRTAAWLEAVDRALTTYNANKFTLEPSLRSRYVAEVRAADLHVKSGVVTTLTAADRPLRAEEALRDMPLMRHPEMSQTRAELSAEITRAGRRTCDRLSTEAAPDVPYWAWAIDRYCHHFGGALTSLPTPPHARGGIEVVGSVQGTDAAETTALRGRVASWFSKSRWYASGSPARAAAAIEGHNAATFDTRRVSFDRPWSERVPYTAIEHGTEAYQEPYRHHEHYTESQPYTASVSESYPCGRSTCTRTRTVTRYRQVSRTRVVTRWRTAYRPTTRIVTRYRDEPRVFHYEADEVRAAYSSNLVVRIDLGGGVEPLVVAVQRESTGSGIAHDVSFDPAGVAPSRPNLASRADFFSQQTGALERQMFASFAQHHARVFCTQVRGVDEAARCLYGNAKPPPAVADAFASKLGEDAPLAVALAHAD